MKQRLSQISSTVLGLLSTVCMVTVTASHARAFEGINTVQRNSSTQAASEAFKSDPPPPISRRENVLVTTVLDSALSTFDEASSSSASDADLKPISTLPLGAQAADRLEVEQRQGKSQSLTPQTQLIKPEPLTQLAAEGLSSRDLVASTDLYIEAEARRAVAAEPGQKETLDASRFNAQPASQTLSLSNQPLRSLSLPTSQSIQQSVAFSPEPAQTEPVVSTLPSSITTPLTSPTQAFTPQIPDGYVEISSGVYVPESFLKADAQFQQARKSRYRAWSAYQAQLSQQSNMVAALLPYTPGISAPDSGMVNQTATTDRFPLYPLPNVVLVSSNYGWRIHPITGHQSFHSGVDLAAATGTPVLSSLSGIVIYAGSMDGYGNTIILRHLDGSIQTLYGHLSILYVEVGESVKQGQIIALSGSTGNSTGPHLHFEIQQRTATGWSSINTNKIVAFAQSVLRVAQQHQADRSPSASPIAFNAQPTTPTTPQETLIRVALEVNASNLSVGASTSMMVLDANGNLLATLPAMQAFDAIPSSAGITIAGQTYAQPLFVAPTSGGNIALNGHYYRGKLLLGIQPNRSGITAVNWVELEQYLYSVVPSEAYPSWGANALFAQAIAARSYALHYRYNPVSDWYDLGSDTRYQAYNGTASEVNTTTQAVNATRHQALFQNDTVLQALYASTDALTASAHNGVGMSQWGAAEMATQGKDYLAILGRYYPGATLRAIKSTTPPQGGWGLQFKFPFLGRLQ